MSLGLPLFGKGARGWPFGARTPQPHRTTGEQGSGGLSVFLTQWGEVVACVGAEFPSPGALGGGVR